MHMCGRYYIGPEVGEKLQVPPGEVFPGQMAPVILRGDVGETIALMKWGFPRIGGGGLVINSRSEKADVTNMFRRAVRERRCLIPMTGFYEWRRSPSGSKSKEKFAFQRADAPEGMMYLAGMWGSFGKGEDGFTGFVLLTQDADEQMQPYHHRMPVILEGESRRHWLYAPADTPYSVFRQMFLPPRLRITAAGENP